MSDVFQRFYVFYFSRILNVFHYYSNIFLHLCCAEFDVPSTRRVNDADDVFDVCAARVWNGLPADVVTLPPFSVVKQPLKTSLFIEEEEEEEDFVQTTKNTAWKLCGDLSQRGLS